MSNVVPGMAEKIIQQYEFIQQLIEQNRRMRAALEELRDQGPVLFDGTPGNWISRKASDALRDIDCPHCEGGVITTDTVDCTKCDGVGKLAAPCVCEKCRKARGET